MCLKFRLCDIQYGVFFMAAKELHHVIIHVVITNVDKELRFNIEFVLSIYLFILYLKESDDEWVKTQQTDREREKMKTYSNLRQSLFVPCVVQLYIHYILFKLIPAHGKRSLNCKPHFLCRFCGWLSLSLLLLLQFYKFVCVC